MTALLRNVFRMGRGKALAEAGKADSGDGGAADRRSLGMPALMRAGLLDPTKRRVRQIEEFRIVQGQALQALATPTARPEALANLLMVSSAKPGEGKSYCSLNLAGGMARSGPRDVILVDLDRDLHTLTERLTLGGLTGLLDMAHEPGLAFDDVLIETALPRLRVLPIGRRDLLGAAASGAPLLGVVGRLGTLYPETIVVLDTAPCLSTSDASMIARVAGHVLLVVEAQGTHRNEVEAALDLVEGCPSIALVLNKVQLSGSGTFGSYGY